MPISRKMSWWPFCSFFSMIAMPPASSSLKSTSLELSVLTWIWSPGPGLAILIAYSCAGAASGLRITANRATHQDLDMAVHLTGKASDPWFSLAAVFGLGNCLVRVDRQVQHALREEIDDEVDDVLDGDDADGPAIVVDDRDVPVAVHAHLVQGEGDAGGRRQRLRIAGHDRSDRPAAIVLAKDDAAKH